MPRTTVRVDASALLRAKQRQSARDASKAQKSAQSESPNNLPLPPSRPASVQSKDRPAEVALEKLTTNSSVSESKSKGSVSVIAKLLMDTDVDEIFGDLKIAEDLASKLEAASIKELDDWKSLMDKPGDEALWVIQSSNSSLQPKDINILRKVIDKYKEESDALVKRSLAPSPKLNPETLLTPVTLPTPAPATTQIQSTADVTAKAPAVSSLQDLHRLKLFYMESKNGLNGKYDLVSRLFNHFKTDNAPKVPSTVIFTNDLSMGVEIYEKLKQNPIVKARHLNVLKAKEALVILDEFEKGQVDVLICSRSMFRALSKPARFLINFDVPRNIPVNDDADVALYMLRLSICLEPTGTVLTLVHDPTSHSRLRTIEADLDVKHDLSGASAYEPPFTAILESLKTKTKTEPVIQQPTPPVQPINVVPAPAAPINGHNSRSPVWHSSRGQPRHSSHPASARSRRFESQVTDPSWNSTLTNNNGWDDATPTSQSNGIESGWY